MFAPLPAEFFPETTQLIILILSVLEVPNAFFQPREHIQILKNCDVLSKNCVPRKLFPRIYKLESLS